jgi:hypothetical protein
MGLRQGPMVARTLQAVERQWIEENFPAQHRTHEIAEQLVAEALGSTPG